MTKRISIRDVALRAGVSVTTVSHVLNDTPGKRISDETRARVRQVADELSYRPNSVARSLRLQRSQILALVSDEIATTPHAGQIILGAQEAASKRGWLLMLVNSGGDRETERAEIRALQQRQVDGFLYATMYHQVVEVPAELADSPVTLLDARSDDPRIPSAAPDEVQGGQAATQLLLDRGHRRIGLINNFHDIPATEGRLEGYHRALRQAGIQPDDGLVMRERSDAVGGYRAGLAMLDHYPRPTAIFCFNDRMAMGLYQAAAERGLRIPEDLSVVGFDNQELIADGLRPGLTTVALPHYEMGAWAVETLIRRIEDPGTPSEQVLLRCPVIERGSVTPPGARPSG
ncbi:LacI family transcriptional regulator [Nocardioides gansuensis]|uniref:LacI family transcriptional regulator n=1 Tax=Nocardioides gansuensis TaxID=2138300 RepID=A0A2T8F6F1_9ACTN|nr:LacI family DNA-binding transcriptional regulator [Nocardioides gansuensis]PVG81291.1 LacI family transcriptional regulator [Nocardioides gansuensis]